MGPFGEIEHLALEGNDGTPSNKTHHAVPPKLHERVGVCPNKSKLGSAFMRFSRLSSRLLCSESTESRAMPKGEPFDFPWSWQFGECLRTFRLTLGPIREKSVLGSARQRAAQLPQGAPAQQGTAADAGLAWASEGGELFGSFPGPLERMRDLMYHL